MSEGRLLYSTSFLVMLCHFYSAVWKELPAFLQFIWCNVPNCKKSTGLVGCLGCTSHGGERVKLLSLLVTGHSHTHTHKKKKQEENTTTTTTTTKGNLVFLCHWQLSLSIPLAKQAFYATGNLGFLYHWQLGLSMPLATWSFCTTGNLVFLYHWQLSLSTPLAT